MPRLLATFASRLNASFLVLSLSACGGGLMPSSSVPATQDFGVAGVRDMGRSRPYTAVNVVVLLRYNHQAELERFVDGLERTSRPRYLTRSEFLARFAPSAAQEGRVLDALRKAGFHVTHRYANRLLIDATAPAEVVERFFSTRIHDFDQRPYGMRTANVGRMQIPSRLAGDVGGVEANGIVLARPDIAGLVAPAATSEANVVKNGGFNTGRLAPWTSCGKAAATISLAHPENGVYDALTGSPTTTPREINGWSAICQRVVIPSNGLLSASLYRQTNEPNAGHAYQEVALADADGDPSIVLEKGNADRAAWVRETWSLAKYAG
jgi:hypothetical protein